MSLSGKCAPQNEHWMLCTTVERTLRMNLIIATPKGLSTGCSHIPWCMTLLSGKYYMSMLTWSSKNSNAHLEPPTDLAGWIRKRHSTLHTSHMTIRWMQ